MTFIKDKNGQWAHPGKNTLIPNADGKITMQGVNYPVLGIDDLGNEQVMMPGGEYQFPGNDVYEIPLANDGKELPNKDFPIAGTEEWNSLYDNMVRHAMQHQQDVMAYNDFMKASDESRMKFLAPVMINEFQSGDMDPSNPGKGKILKQLMLLLSKAPQVAPSLFSVAPFMAAMLLPTEAGRGSTPQGHRLQRALNNPTDEDRVQYGIFREGGQLPKFQGPQLLNEVSKARTTLNTLNQAGKTGFIPSLIDKLPSWLTKPFTPTPLLPMKTRYYQDIGYKIASQQMPLASNYDDFSLFLRDYNTYMATQGRTPSNSSIFSSSTSTPMIKSLSGENNLIKNKDKHGNIDITTVQSFINKTPSPADKIIMQTALDDLTTDASTNLDLNFNAQQMQDKADQLLKDGLIGEETYNLAINGKLSGEQLLMEADILPPIEITDKFKNKLSYDAFEQKVADGIFKYIPQYTDRYSDYGINRIGYNKSMVQTAGGYEIENSQGEYDNVLKTFSIMWQIPELGATFGEKTKAHWLENPMGSLTPHGPKRNLGPNDIYGHTRVLIDSRMPNTAIIPEFQADEFQISQNKLIRENQKLYQTYLKKEHNYNQYQAEWTNGYGLSFENFKGAVLYPNNPDYKFHSPYLTDSKLDHSFNENSVGPDIMRKYVDQLQYNKRFRTGKDKWDGMPEYDEKYNIGQFYKILMEEAPTSTTKHFQYTIPQAHQVYKEMQLADVDPNGVPGKFVELDDIMAGAYNYMHWKTNDQAKSYAHQAKNNISKLEQKIKDIKVSYDKTTSAGAQKSALYKNYWTRQFQETLKVLGEQGYTTIHFPLAETTAAIQGYTKTGGIETGLERVLENPWTHTDVTQFDNKINNLFTANTQVGKQYPTKVAKKYGPFVVIPDSHNMVYSVDTPGSNIPNFKSTAIGVEGQTNNVGVPIEGLETSETWKGIFLKKDRGKYIGSKPIDGQVTYKDATHLQVREERYFESGAFDGTQAGGVNRTSKWENRNTDIDIPADIRDNLQAGMYYIDENGKWNFVNDGSNTEVIQNFTRNIRQQNHKLIADENPFNYKDYNEKYQPILKRIEKEVPKMLDKILGPDNKKIIYNHDGKPFYEFKNPFPYQIGKGDIKAFSTGGEIKQQGGGLRKFQEGGEGGGVDYSNTEEVNIDGNVYYKYKIKKGDTKSSISKNYGLWNEQAILNSVNSKVTGDKDSPNYAKNVNRMWAGDEILVGGPEFQPHVDYATNRSNYASSFADIPEDQLWSAITAIGHLETGSLVKYKKPEGRVYITGEDLDEAGGTISGGKYDLDRHPFIGDYESGIDNAYSYVSSANALGRFGIKEEHLNEYAKEVLGYKEEDNWRTKYLNSKTDQQKLMKYLITNIYPNELVQLRHSYAKATSQYSDFELLAALHRAGQPKLREQLAKGEFSHKPVKNDISVGGYTDRVSTYLDPNLDVSESPFFMKNQPHHSTFTDIPTYKFGGSTNKIGSNVRDEVIGDMLENEAFLPKFKTGAEKNIEGILGNYNIKKGYDDDIQLSYVEYNTSDKEKIKDNRIYYDKNNIIDVYKQKSEQERAQSRIKSMIEKYEEGVTLNETERREMERLGLLDNTTVEIKQKEEIAPMMYGGASMPLNKINVSKDLFNKTDGNNYGLSLASQILLYEARVRGTLDKDEKFKKLKNIYNKLNTLYYNDAKASKLTVLDYMKSLNN